MSGGGTNTVQQSSAPPSSFENALGSYLPTVQQIGSTPYTPYSGQQVAGFTPQQDQAFTEVQNAQGAQNPYLSSANQYIGASTTPLSSSIPTPYNAAISSGQLPSQALGATTAASGPAIGNATAAGQAGITGAAGSLTPGSVQQWMSPYTSDVVNATQAEFNNQNAQEGSSLAGNAISSGAWGGDRAQVAQGIAAGQEQLAQAPQIASLENTGYQTGLGAAEAASSLGLQGATAAGQLGLSGASAEAQQQQTTAQQLLGTVSGQQNLELGANEANAWLNSQAGFGEANLGNEALNTSLTGANALEGVGALGQSQEQANLNVPYEQYIQQQAYPFQTAGWETGELGNLSASAGGTGTTSYPGASPFSQALGAGLTTAGIGNETGAFGSSGYLSSLFGGSGAAGIGSLAAATADTTAGLAGSADAGLDFAMLGAGVRRGGTVTPRAIGGGVGHMPHLGGIPIGVHANTNLVPRPHSLRMAASGGRMRGYANGSVVEIDPQAWLGGSDTASPLSAAQDFLDTHTGSDVPPPAARGPAGPLIPPSYGMPSAGFAPPVSSSPMAPPRIGEGAGWGPISPGAGPAASGSSPPPRRGTFSGAPPAPPVPPGASASPDAAPSNVLPMRAGMGAGYGPPSTSSNGTDWGRALTYAGLGILSGKSPQAGVNIGEGGLEGLKLYDAERARQTQEDSTVAYRQSEVQRQQSDAAEHARHDVVTETTEQKHLSDVAAEVQERLANDSARLGIEGANSAETARYHNQELGRRSFVGNDPQSGLPLFADSQGNITTGSQPIGLKPADAARAATSAANTSETARFHDQLAQRGASGDEIRLIQAQPALAGMPPDQALAAARKALGTASPAGGAPAVPMNRPAPPAAAIEFLKSNPKAAPDFISKYGADAYSGVFGAQ